MFDRLLSLLHYGEENVSRVTARRKIQHLNTIVLIAVAVYTSYVLFYWMFSGSSIAFRNSAIVVAAFIPFVFIARILNKRGKPRLAPGALGIGHWAIGDRRGALGMGHGVQVVGI